MSTGNEDVPALALRWLDDGRALALATVIRTWGSAPQAAGAQMVIDRNGGFAGSVSGGCIEGAVIEAARQVIDDGGMRRLKFGVSDERAWEVGLACGGEIEILLEPLA